METPGWWMGLLDFGKKTKFKNLNKWNKTWRVVFIFLTTPPFSSKEYYVGGGGREEQEKNNSVEGVPFRWQSYLV